MCTEVFKGRASGNNEVCKAYGKWLPYIVDLYLPICDTESGDLRVMPFRGVYVDQPYIVMTLIRLIQMQYRVVVREEMRRT